MSMPKFMVLGPTVQAAGVVYRQTNGTLGNIYIDMPWVDGQMERWNVQARRCKV